MTCAQHIRDLLNSIDGDEKFVMVVGAGIINAIFLAAGILSEPGYLTILGGTVFAYITGKVVEDIHTEKMEHKNANMAQA